MSTATTDNGQKSTAAKPPATAVEKQQSPRDRAIEIQKRAVQAGNLKGFTQRDLQAFFNSMGDRIALALPKHITPERMVAMYTMMVSRNPKIAECTLESIVGSLMFASMMGFSPVPALGECWFIPRKNNRNGGKMELNYQTGYKGIISLAYRSGMIKMLYSELVYKGDEFSYELGLHKNLVHKRNPTCKYRNEDITHVYAVVHYIYGGFDFKVLDAKEVERHRMLSPDQKEIPSGTWEKFKPEMYLKTGIMALKNYLPQSPEMQKVIAAEDHTLKPDMFIPGEGLAVERVEDATWTDEGTGEIHDMPDAAEETTAAATGTEAADDETEGVREEDIAIMQEQINECDTVEQLETLKESTALALVEALGDAWADRRIEIVKKSAKGGRK